MALFCLCTARADIMVVDTLQPGFNLIGNPFVNKTTVGTLLAYDEVDSPFMVGATVYAATAPYAKLATLREFTVPGPNGKGTVTVVGWDSTVGCLIDQS